MLKRILSCVFFVPGLLFSFRLSAQNALTIDQIMQDPAWIGSQPDRIRWAANSQQLYFYWNPDAAPADSLYSVAVEAPDKPQKLSLEAQRLYPFSETASYNQDRSARVYAHQGELFWEDIASGKITRLTQTTAQERNPQFVMQDQAVAFQDGDDLFLWYPATGERRQLTHFVKGEKRSPKAQKNDNNQQWLQQEELALMEVLAERKAESEARDAARKQLQLPAPKAYYLGKEGVRNLQLSPDGRFATFQLLLSADDKSTDVPNYIDESAYSKMLTARPKVGGAQDRYRFGIYAVALDSVFILDTDELPGIRKAPDFVSDYGLSDTLKKPKAVVVNGPVWSDDGSKAMVVIRSQDFKDRWIALLDAENVSLKVLDHQHDEAWIDGPGIGRWYGSVGDAGWLQDNETVWFQSEASGYSHLYTLDTRSMQKQQLTEGKFEIYDPRLSRDGKSWYFTSNEVHPGIRHFYRMPVRGGKRTQLTSGTGNHEVTLSPDEQWLAVRFSTTNRPWQLYLMKNAPGAKMKPITESISKEWLAYPWREPEMKTFAASDGQEIYARLYRPENATPNGPAVIFVHGAGYLQNAHSWWSSYFREYMFHNLLVDHGYTVLDMDFRASAGYGRDVRTGVYRDMGGKDLSDQVDGARWLVEQYGIDPARIGLYGGSYGGFITLMAMFREPGTFACGAALRPVTDWAHYNHGYTASMLNMPQEDSLAYVRSSPIYYADGLEGALLICHGMVDTNVHFQDVVRLAQRLIELRKRNWELAVYPVESHGFVEPTSWADEYSRIYKLFEENLKK